MEMTNSTHALMQDSTNVYTCPVIWTLKWEEKYPGESRPKTEACCILIQAGLQVHTQTDKVTKGTLIYLNQ